MVNIRTLCAGLGYLLHKSTQILQNSAPVQPRNTNYSLPVQAIAQGSLADSGQTLADLLSKAGLQGQLSLYDWKLLA